ncbi:MAG: flagellar export chaperone FliS [Sporomusaceae bacterium]|nr:flagellar export chaperone FliS [Sporomusaceae bacterium]
MNAAAMANAYKTQQIMTASPEELTLMLYNGTLRFVNESVRAIDQQDAEAANRTNLRAQAIVRELMNTLDTQYEVAQSMLPLYEYMERRLIEGNIQKDSAPLLEVKALMTELRDSWATAMKSVRADKAVAR